MTSALQNGRIRGSDKAPQHRVNGLGHGTEGITSMQDVPYGYCRCGCGQKTRLAHKTHTGNGHVKGEPRPYLKGHSVRSASLPHRIEDRGHDTPCWAFGGCLDRQGYGSAVRRLVSSSQLAHRISWEWRNGPVPTGLELDHLCRQRDCINPDHLEAVPHTENMRRASNTRLTLEIVAAIRADCDAAMAADPTYRNGNPRTTLPSGAVAQVADTYGIGPGYVRSIYYGRSWIEGGEARRRLTNVRVPA